MGLDKTKSHSKEKIRSASITEAEKVNALQESEAKFRAYTENAPLGIFVADMAGNYVEVNRAACQMSGYTEEGVKAICHRIKEKCKVTYVNNNPLSLALGYAVKNNTKTDLVEILQEAEENMYEDKLAGKQQV